MRQSAYQAGYRAYNLGLGRCPHSRGSFLTSRGRGVGGTPSAPRGPPSATSFAPAFARTSNDALFGV